MGGFSPMEKMLNCGFIYWIYREMGIDAFSTT